MTVHEITTPLITDYRQLLGEPAEVHKTFATRDEAQEYRRALRTLVRKDAKIRIRTQILDLDDGSFYVHAHDPNAWDRPGYRERAEQQMREMMEGAFRFMGDLSPR